MSSPKKVLRYSNKFLATGRSFPMFRKKKTTLRRCCQTKSQDGLLIAFDYYCFKSTDRGSSAFVGGLHVRSF